MEEHRDACVAFVLSYENQVLRAVDDFTFGSNQVFTAYLGKIVNAHKSRVANSQTSTPEMDHGFPASPDNGEETLPVGSINDSAIPADHDSPDENGTQPHHLWKTFLQDFRKAGIGAAPATRRIFCDALKQVISKRHDGKNEDSEKPLYVPDLFIEAQSLAMTLAAERGYEREKSWDAARKGMMRLIIKAKAILTSVPADELDEFRAERAIVHSLASDFEVQTKLYLVRYIFQTRREVHISQYGDLALAIFHEGKTSGIFLHKIEGEVRNLVRCLEELGEVELDVATGFYRIAKPVAVAKAADIG